MRMNPGKDTAAIAQGSPKRLAPPSQAAQRDPGQVAALLQSIANEISQSDQRQGHALADLRSRLDQMAVQGPPQSAAEESRPADESAISGKKPSIALPDLRPSTPPRSADAAKAERFAPEAVIVTASVPAGLDQIYAAVAASYSEAASRKSAKVSAAQAVQKPVHATEPAWHNEAPDDAASEFMDMSALAEPHRPAPSPAKPVPALRAEPVAQSGQPAPRPVVAASLAVEKSIGELTRRVAETEAKAEQAMQRANGSDAVNVHVEALRAELEKLTSEHAKVSVEVGKVSSDVRSLSEAAGRIGPMGDTLEHLNEAILTLRKDMPGFAEAAADRASAQFAASQPAPGNTAELAEKLATVQSLLVAQSRENQETGGRSFGALESIRGLVENLHSRIDALEAGDPEPATPMPVAAVRAEAARQPVLMPEPAPISAPSPSMSREELIASARRAAMAASQKIEVQAAETPSAPARSLRELLPKPAGGSLFDRRGVGALGGLAMVALLAVGSGVMVTKMMRRPAPNMTIEKVSLPAMPDDLPDAVSKDKAAAQPPKMSDVKDASKPVPMTPKAGEPAPAAPGKTSALAPAAQDVLAANADEIPKAMPAKPVMTAEASPAATAEALPAGIGPLSTRDAAIAGDPTAAYTIAERFLAGKGVTRNPKMAGHWYEQAAKAGSANAEFRLGALYEKGDEGIASDKAKARTWYRRGADHGNVQAMHNLAVLYAAQAGGTPDYASAAKWFEEAAGYGLKDSQYNLAVLYQNGLGVKKDLPTAYKWFAIGAARGDAEAAKQRDELHKNLPAAALAGLEPQIKAWHARQPQQAAGIVPMAPTAEAEVTTVQKMLVQLGYDPGAVDGKLSAQTREAIHGFEQRSGLPDDGEISETLLAKLKALAG